MTNWVKENKEYYIIEYYTQIPLPIKEAIVDQIAESESKYNEYFFFIISGYKMILGR